MTSSMKEYFLNETIDELSEREAQKDARIEELEAALRDIADNKTGDPWDGIAIAHDTLVFHRVPENTAAADARIEALEAALRWIIAKTDDHLAAEFARTALENK